MKKYFAALLASFTLSAGTVFADDVVIHTDGNFQVLSLSPNGHWACGVYVDASHNTFPFRWNLLSGSVQVLGSKAGTAWDVANDGTISGDYPDTEVQANHAPVDIPCYWRGNTRYSLEMPKGQIADGMGTGITPDGRFMTGSICNNGIYTSYVWNEGRLVRDLKTGNHNVAMCISPDGEDVAGWSMKYNRTACMWTADGNSPIFFEDSPYCMGPFNYARNFSPDGSKLLYWGGWEQDEAKETLSLYCIYDVKTGERKKVTTRDSYSELEFYDISNNEMLVGDESGRGFVYVEGQGMFIDEYLQLKGVDIKKLCSDMYAGSDYYVGQLPISKVVAVSEDEKVLAMQYYNTKGETCSMVLKLDQDFSTAVPVEIGVRQLEGLRTVALNWKAPVGASGVRGYYIYRDGQRLNTLPTTKLYYYDSKASDGEHSYEVALVTTKGAINKAEAITLDVTVPMAQAPYGLHARQKGVNSAFASWQSPLSNVAHKHYFELGASDISDFAIYEAIDMEVAVRFDKEEMAEYKNHKISEVSFIPLARQESWKINLYTRDSNQKLQAIYSQPVTQELQLGVLNTVKLDEAQAVPGGELIVAIEVETNGESTQLIGAQAGMTKPGYSDLLRQMEEEDYISAYQSSVETGYSLARMTWTIDLGLQADDGEGESVSHYNIYLDGELAATSTVNSCQLPGVSDGKHELSVEAEYANGKRSQVIGQELHIAANYPKVSEVEVSSEGDNFTATWQAPCDNDLTQIAYTNSTTIGNGVHGNDTQAYAFMAASEYTSDMLRGYGGYRISAFRFYPMSDAIFTFYLFENGQLIYEQEVDQDLKFKQWNAVALNEPLYINEHAKYTLVIDCFDPEPEVDVLALDPYLPFENQSDLVSIDGGQSWMSLSVEKGINGSWMMGMQIEDNDSTPLDIDGYDVYVDSRKANADMLTATSYSGSVTKAGTHSLRVNTHYAGKDAAVAGTNISFTTVADAIADAQADTHEAAAYNLQGIRVKRDYRGAIIQQRRLTVKE